VRSLPPPRFPQPGHAPLGERPKDPEGPTLPVREKCTSLAHETPATARVDAAGSSRQRRPPSVAPRRQSRGPSGDSRLAYRPSVTSCSVVRTRASSLPGPRIRLTHTISCGPGRRDACASKRRDGTDRQLDRVVGPHAADWSFRAHLSTNSFTLSCWRESPIRTLEFSRIHTGKTCFRFNEMSNWPLIVKSRSGPTNTWP
jgi:hypothetical protein